SDLRATSCGKRRSRTAGSDHWVPRPRQAASRAYEGLGLLPCRAALGVEPIERVSRVPGVNHGRIWDVIKAPFARKSPCGVRLPLLDLPQMAPRVYWLASLGASLLLDLTTHLEFLAKAAPSPAQAGNGRNKRAEGYAGWREPQ